MRNGRIHDGRGWREPSMNLRGNTMSSSSSAPGTFRPSMYGSFKPTGSPIRCILCGRREPVFSIQDRARRMAVTVGSMAPTTLAEGQVARARAIALRDYASPFTRCGPGIRKETKPDLIDYGGNYLVDEEGGQVRINRALGVPVATHQLTPALRYDSGTSLAAPRAALHKLALILGDLRALGIEPTAALLKAFLINSAQYRIGGADLEAFQAAVGAGTVAKCIGIRHGR